MPKPNDSYIFRQVASRVKCGNEKKAKEYIRAFIDVLGEDLRDYGETTLSGFGTFVAKRIGGCKQQVFGKEKYIMARDKVTFIESEKFKCLVNEWERNSKGKLIKTSYVERNRRVPVKKLTEEEKVQSRLDYLRELREQKEREKSEAKNRKED